MGGARVWKMKGASRLLCSLVVVLALLSGCSRDEERKKEAADEEQSPAGEQVHEPQLLSVLPEEAAQLLGREPTTVVVDVRTDQGRQEVRIPGSLPVSLDEIMAGKAELPRDKPLLLVCDVGGRSYAAGLFLLKDGYARLYNLRGGIAAWQRHGMAVESGAK